MPGKVLPARKDFGTFTLCRHGASAEGRCKVCGHTVPAEPAPKKTTPGWTWSAWKRAKAEMDHHAETAHGGKA